MSIKIKAVSCIKGVHFQGKEIQNIDIQAKKTAGTNTSCCVSCFFVSAVMYEMLSL